MKNLNKYEGTIAKVFTNNIYKFNSVDPNELRRQALILLDDKSIKDNKAVEEAKKRFINAKDSAIMSLITTYSLGERVL